MQHKPPVPEDARWQRGLDDTPQRQRARRGKRKRSREQKLYVVPRRFDIATLLVVSLVYSLLFGFLAALGSPWQVHAFIGMLTVSVAVAQGLFPYGNEPRWASAITGLVYCLLWSIAVGIAFQELETACGGLAISVLLGPLIGYFCGACEAGVFLLAAIVRNRWFSESQPNDSEPTSPF